MNWLQNLTTTTFTISLHLVSTQAIAMDTPPLFQACIDFHCDIVEQVDIADQEWQKIRNLFSSRPSALNERKQIRQAIADLETLVGKQIGTWRDLAKNGEPPIIQPVESWMAGGSFR